MSKDYYTQRKGKPLSQPNIVLIVIDALRARNLSCYGYDKLTCPNIDALANSGSLFERCFSTINCTDPSFTTILSGKFPASHGMVEQAITDESIYSKKLEGLVLLQSILKKQGYSTIGVDWLGRWHQQGFENYSGPIGGKMKLLNDMLNRRIKSHKSLNSIIEFIKSKTNPGIFSGLYAPYDKAGTVTDYALKTLDKKGKDSFFLFIHYWDTHMPYEPPSAHLKLFEKESYHPEIEDTQAVWQNFTQPDFRDFMMRYIRKMKSTKEVLARYDASLHYVDAEINRVVDKISKMGVLENTIFVITADHGESLTEHGIFFDHHGLYDELIHVPLVIYYPKTVPAKRIKTDVQHIDVVPTILDLAGIEYADGDFDGKSLTPLFNDIKDNNDFHPFIFVEEARSERKFAIRTRKYKYIFALSEKDAICDYCGRIHGGVEELYDLEKDPEEKVNIVDKNPAVRDNLREAVIKFRAGLEAKRQRHGLEGKIQKLKTNNKI